MRYILLLVIALALTITWQTSVVADNPIAAEPRCETGSARDIDFTRGGLGDLICR